MHCPLQRSLQSNTNCSGGHSIWIFILYKFYASGKISILKTAYMHISAISYQIFTIKAFRPKLIKLSQTYLSVKLHTFAAVIVFISRVTSTVTMSSLIVPWRVVQTVSTTAVDTVIYICPVITLCNRYWYWYISVHVHLTYEIKQMIYCVGSGFHISKNKRIHK